MDNENKNAPAQTQNHHHHKNKGRKHKSYFLTPAEASADNVKAQNPSSAAQNVKHNSPAPHKVKQNDKADNAAEAVNSGVSTQQNTPSKNNRNRNKRRKHGDRNRDTQNSTAVSQPQNTVEASNEPKLDIAASSFTKKSDKLEKPAPKKMDKFLSSPEFEKYSDYEEFSYAEIYGTEEDIPSAALPSVENVNTEDLPADNEPMVTVVGIRFKASGKTYFFDPKGIFFKVGSHAIVETARGLEYGEVALANTKVKESETVPPLRAAVRVATEADIKHHAENKEKENEAFRLCNEKIIEHKLDMKLIDAQYTFDNSKLLFYFTSSGRVDFRELVKDLAGVFRTRIELRQIGIRDEAKMVGGLGLCGRPLCCSLFLTDFGQVSIKMAKEQNLSLNSSKISGICGRLMCCLRYEHDTYEYEIKRTPPVDTLVRTVDGVGVVTETSPLAGTIKVRLNESPEVPPKSYKREEVSILKKKK